ncbi:MAG: phosphatase PAP2 family protein [Proteobacteria bacterium]|nr:phosphatase PAP2 family protein [Pseudomonadota bacterium]
MYYGMYYELAAARYPAWHLITRLGEAQVMLPATFAVLAWFALRPNGRALAGWWFGLMSAAVALTTASKIAFIGYGVGIAGINYTGVSGHSMFAAVVYPLLFRVLASGSPLRERIALAGGIALAALVGYSRLVLGAHSLSEVLAGWALGGLATAAALWLARVPAVRLPAWLPLAVFTVVPLLVGSAPPSRSHDIVTRLSLAISGRSAPYTRAQMLRDARLRAPMRAPDLLARG